MNRKKVIVFWVVVATVMSILVTSDESVAAQRSKLNKKRISLKVGTSKKLKVMNIKGKAHWSIKSGKKYIKLKCKKRNSVKVYGVKKGTAKVRCKVGKKKMLCKVNVTVEKDPTSIPLPTAMPKENKQDTNTASIPAPTVTPQVLTAPSATPKLTATPETTPIGWDATEIVSLQTAGPVAAYDRLMVETAVSMMYIKPTPGGIIYEDMRFFGSGILRKDIEQITISDVNEVPEDVLGVIDVSEKQNESVRAWYVDADDNGKYELTIAQDGGVIANENSAYLFAGLGCDAEKGEEHQMLVGLEHLDTCYVTDMTEMFAEMSVPSNVLDLGCYFDISNVVKAERMFRGTGNRGEIQCYTSNKETYQWLRDNAENMVHIIYGNSEIKVTGDYLMVEPQNIAREETTYYVYDDIPEYYFLGSKIPRSQIEQLQIVKTAIVSEDAIGSFDISANQNGSIMAWYIDKDQDGKYEMTIGQEGGVVANPNSSYLFSWIGGPIVGLENLNTEYVWNMEAMFASMVYTTELDLGNIFDTSNVTNMDQMFLALGYKVAEGNGKRIRLGECFVIGDAVRSSLGLEDGFIQSKYHLYVSTEELKERLKDFAILMPPAGYEISYDWIIVEE